MDVREEGFQDGGLTELTPNNRIDISRSHPSYSAARKFILEYFFYY
jgi:hypothetical protein